VESNAKVVEFQNSKSRAGERDGFAADAAGGGSDGFLDSSIGFSIGLQRTQEYPLVAVVVEDHDIHPAIVPWQGAAAGPWPLQPEVMAWLAGGGETWALAQ